MKVNFKKMGIAFLIIFLYLLIIPQILGIFLKPIIMNFQGNYVIATIVNLLVYVIDLLVIIFIYRKSLFKELKDYIKNFKDYFKVALNRWGKGFILMFLANIILISVVGNMAGNEQTNREILNAMPIFSVITMVFLGPVIEEIAFRKGFREVFKSDKVFLIFTSLLFGSMHVINGLDFQSGSSLIQSLPQLFYIIPYSILGYFFGKAYLDTNCIFTSITSHFIHNGLSVLLILVSQMLL